MNTKLREKLYRLGTAVAQFCCDHPKNELQPLKMRDEKPLPLSHFDAKFAGVEAERRKEGKPVLHAQSCDALCGKCGKVVRAARITTPTKTCREIEREERTRSEARGNRCAD